MLEIIGQILCTLLLFKGVELIAQALNRQGDNAIGFIVPFVGAVASIIAAIYFFSIISSQASGARNAMEEATQNMQDSQRSLQQSIEKFERDTGIKVP
jgi:hypothetical protein